MKPINTSSKLQKEINLISRCEMITGQLFVEVEVNATNYKELEEKQENILKDLNVPKGLKINDNLLYRKGLEIYISFKMV